MHIKQYKVIVVSTLESRPHLFSTLHDRWGTQVELEWVPDSGQATDMLMRSFAITGCGPDMIVCSPDVAKSDDGLRLREHCRYFCPEVPVVPSDVFSPRDVSSNKLIN